MVHPLPFLHYAVAEGAAIKQDAGYEMSSASLLRKCFELEKSQNKVRHLAECLSKLDVKKLERRMNVMSQD